MITEDYISFEIAKLLKEKGFIENCLMRYSKVGDLVEEAYKFNWNFQTIDYSAPTLQIVMKWLREVHNMYYEIQLLLGEKAEKYGDLKLGIYQLSSSGSYVWKDWIYADTYVELYENYIKYCLENLI